VPFTQIDNGLAVMVRDTPATAMPRRVLYAA
jgi:hypothetical protein